MNNFLIKNFDYGNSASSSSKTPLNVLLRDAALNIVHRFDVSGGTLDKTNWNSIGYRQIIDDLELWWRTMSDVLHSGTGSRSTVSMADMLDYLQNVVELRSLMHSILGLRAIVDLDWEATFNEPEPIEINFMRTTYVGGALSQFTEIVETALRRVNELPLPPMLAMMIADFHSPFLLSPNGRVVCMNVFDARLLVYTNVDVLQTVIDFIHSEVDGIHAAFPTELNVAHNFFPWGRHSVFPTFDRFSPHKALGWKNSSNTSFVGAYGAEYATLIDPIQTIGMKRSVFGTGGGYSPVGDAANLSMHDQYRNTTVNYAVDRTIYAGELPPDIMEVSFISIPVTGDVSSNDASCREGINIGLANYGEYYPVRSTGVEMMVPVCYVTMNAGAPTTTDTVSYFSKYISQMAEYMPFLLITPTAFATMTGCDANYFGFGVSNPNMGDPRAEHYSYRLAVTEFARQMSKLSVTPVLETPDRLRELTHLSGVRPASPTVVGS